MDKIARIDMGAAGGPKVTEEPVGKYLGLGGRAMTSIVVATEVHPLAHPLGAENKLVIAPGMLSGTTGSMTGRLSVGCKSPLTGTIKESGYEHPHGHIRLDADGKLWTAVLAPPSRMEARGLSTVMLKPGNTASVVGYANRSKPDELRVERITIGGKTVELR